MFDYDDIPSDVRQEMNAERARRARAYHWCDECRGHTGKGSPCYEPEPEEEEEEA